MKGPAGAILQSDVIVQAEKAQLEGNLALPEGANAIVLFAHGSGSSRHSPRNRSVATTLNEAGLATLLFDLLTPDEERIDQQTRAFRFDIDLLANRLTGAVDWVGSQAS
jgi:putative phosphoribosyl transferase